MNVKFVICDYTLFEFSPIGTQSIVGWVMDEQEDYIGLFFYLNVFCML